MSESQKGNSAPSNSKIETLPSRTQFLIFTLFGDYVLERGGKIWTRSLVQLMSLLDVSERAVRSTLSRMTQKGWIYAEKHGRLSQYIFTDDGRTLLERGQRRIFESTFSDWDGQWHIITYSLPEKHRSLRHTLRTQLTWLGFGSLVPGAWISPHNRAESLKPFITELGIEKYVDMFTGGYLGPSVPENLVGRCWDLSVIEGQYQGLIDRYEKEYKKLLKSGSGVSKVSPQESFIRRFWLTHMFQSFPLKDPNLPVSLLPNDWVGIKGRKLFDNYHRLLGREANQFVDEVISGDHEKEAI